MDYTQIGLMTKMPPGIGCYKPVMTGVAKFLHLMRPFFGLGMPVFNRAVDDQQEPAG